MSRRGENIYKRKDGRWEGRYIKYRDHSGKAIYGYIYSKTYKETKEKLAKAKSERTANSFPQNNYVLFSNIAYRWLESSKVTCKPSTYVKYRNAITKHILPELGNYTFDQIDTKVINLFIFNKLQNNGLAPKSVTDLVSIIKLIIKHAKKLEINCSCNFDEISIKTSNQGIKTFTNNHTKRITEYLVCNIDNVNIGILISFYTGIRIGELCALKFNDISFDSNTIIINKTMQRIQNFTEEKNKTNILISSPKSQCSIREIPIPQFIIDIIKENNLYKKDAYLLTGKTEKIIEPRTLENKFNKIATICGIEKATFHMIRHTFASCCIEAGVDAKSLSEILGHSNVNITLNKYVHSSMQSKKKNMEKLYSYSSYCRH